MECKVIGYRPLLRYELFTREPLRVSRRGILSGIASASIVGATCRDPTPAVAQVPALATVEFVSGVLDIAQRLIKLFQTATAHGAVRNNTTEQQKAPLLITLLDEEGSVEREQYNVVVVPPGVELVMQVSINVGGSAGNRIMRATSAVNYAEGALQVIE
jgi:hypothetical protein